MDIDASGLKIDSGKVTSKPYLTPEKIAATAGSWKIPGITLGAVITCNPKYDNSQRSNYWTKSFIC